MPARILTRGIPFLPVLALFALLAGCGGRNPAIEYDYDSYPFDAVGTVDVEIDDYLQGTLIVDIATSDGKQPIWRGWAEGVIREKLSDEQARVGVKDALRRILAIFPPPAARKKG